MLRAVRSTIRFFRNDSYRLIPQHTDSISTKGSRWTGAALYVTVLVIYTMILLAASRWLTSVPYSPLANYQNLDPPNLVDKIRVRPPSSPNTRAVVSTLYSDSFVMGAAVLGHSIRAANVSARLLLPYLEGRVSAQALCISRAVGWEPMPVPFIPPPHNGKDIHYRFHDQYTKLNIWALDKLGVGRAVYLDADTLVLQNFDELFDIPFSFAAVPDVYIDERGFSITFNAGVLAFQPSSAILDVMKEKISTAVFPLKQAEQAFLNLFFSTNVVRLPYAYNANLAIKKANPLVWEGLKKEMRIVHYTMIKPFLDDSPGLPSILTEEMQRNAIDQSAKRNDGEYSEEVGWWSEAYNNMMRDTRAELQACYH